VAVVLGAIAVAGGRLTLLLWASSVAVLAIGTALWARDAWGGVEVTASFHPSRAYLSEPVSLRVRITNPKNLPLPIVRLAVWLPPGLLPTESEGATAIRGYHRRLYLPARSEALLDLPVRLSRRGEYWLDRIEVELSDPFDLAPLRRELVPEADLIVLPEPSIQIPARVRRRLPFGRPVPAARMFEERERFAGVRPYEAGDPLNRIHWKLTGHTGLFQTKLFEPTRSGEVAMDLSVGEPFWDAIFPQVAEDTIGWAAFLARQAIDAGWRVGLLSNTHFSRGRGPLRISASLAKGHEAALFAALARMPNEPTSDLAPVLAEGLRLAGHSPTVVLISPDPGPGLRHQVVQLRRRGVEVVQVSPLDVRPRWGWRSELDANREGA
jgi:uncharacterized protein (DUF58 family)